jgi:hypothetical protein
VDHLRPELLKAKRSVPKKPVEAVRLARPGADKKVVLMFTQVEAKMHRFHRQNLPAMTTISSPAATAGASVVATPLLPHGNSFSGKNNVPRGPHSSIAVPQVFIPTGGPVGPTTSSIQSPPETPITKEPVANGPISHTLPTVDITAAP